jgi:hypothetical protein
MDEEINRQYCRLLPVLWKKDKLPEILVMEKGYFSLEMREDNRLTKIIRILFGIVLLIIAVFWSFYNFKSVKADGTLWITLIFLIAFGLFQILTGFGFTKTFIELNNNNIRLKKQSLLPPVVLHTEQIEGIELFPFKVHFLLVSGKKVLLRFGISDPDKVDLIKAEILSFADANNLKSEIISEEIG